MEPSISASKAFRLAAIVTALAGPVAAPSALIGQSPVSGIVNYIYDANPKEIKPKMYNWEVKLNGPDSRAGPYEIVQITKPVQRPGGPAEPVTDVLIESRMIVPGSDSVIHFDLYVGDKTPKENMGRRGNSGEPIIASGRGTGKGASSWIVFPGANIDKATPSVAGTSLSNGTLPLIRFLVSNDQGERFETDVVLRRK
jgi:hypothetical protein